MACLLEDNTEAAVTPLPSWFKQDLPDMAKVREMKGSFRRAGLHTVCESALCPNLGQCWGHGVATFMILGEICTRACRFCGVKTGHPAPVDPREPRQVALAVQRLNLRYVVVTSVARDDLADGGAGQFVETIHAIRSLMPRTRNEVLIPDFSNKTEFLEQLAAARPEVISHNMETVRRLSPDVRPQADYDRSMAVLGNLKKLAPSAFIKSGFMVGLGETDEEITELMRDLAAVGCDMLTIGQYLAPGRKRRYLRVQRFVPPEKFQEYKIIGRELGFWHVMSAPLVRSSYIAEEGYRECFEKSVNGG